MGFLSIEVKHKRQFADVTRRLKQAKGTIRRDATAGLKAAGARTLAKVKHNVETLRMRGFRVPARRSRRGETASIRRFTERRPGTRIRKRISRVTEYRVSTSAGTPELRFVVRASKLGDAVMLPWYFDKGVKFRHPIMVKRKDLPGPRWAAQQASPSGWFRETILRDLPEIRKEIDRQLDRTRRELDGRRR